MISEETKAYYDLKKRNDVRESAKRIRRQFLRYKDAEIISMLQAIKEQGVLIGLISNCYLEEATRIRESELFPYFDAVFFSNEQGICKPEKEIYYRCMEALSVQPQECLYVGDGGSHELETAEEIGMKAVQATWYLIFSLFW